MDHADRQSQEPYWQDIKHNVVHYILNGLRLEKRFNEDEILHVVGVLSVNAFAITTPGSPGGQGRGLYPLTAVMSHKCICNTR